MIHHFPAKRKPGIRVGPIAAEPVSRIHIVLLRQYRYGCCSVVAPCNTGVSGMHVPGSAARAVRQHLETGRIVGSE